MAASTYLNQIQQLYIAYFGRPADPVGLTFWATQVDAANGSVAAVIAGFSASSESNALYSGVPTPQKVSAIYLNLFNRLPEAAGLAYWVAQIDSGAVTQAQAAYQIQSSAGPGDASAVANKLAMANSFTAQIDTAAEVSGYSGAISAAYGRAYLAAVDSTPASVSSATSNLLSAVATATGTSLSTPVTPTPSSPAGATTTYVLTTGIDNLTGTAADDLFTALIDTTNAANSTLTAGDTLNGGAGTDTLSLTVQGTTATSWPGANVSNIERLLISDRHTINSFSTYNLSGVTGLTTVASSVSTGAVIISGLQVGTTVAMIGDGVTSLGNISVNGLGNGAVNFLITGGTKGAPNISSTGGATTATINSTGAANTMGDISLNSSSSLSSLTINATTDLTAKLGPFDFNSNSTLTVTGAGKVELGTSVPFTGSTINASANSGGLNMAVPMNIKNFVGSSGGDRLYGNAGVLTNPVSIDGGAGIDTVAARLINSNNATAFKGFEVLDLTGGTSNGAALDVSQMTGSTITGVLLDGGTTSNATLNGLSLSPSGFNVNVTGNSIYNNTTLNFNDVSATNDVLNYTFNPTLTTAAYAGTVRSDGIETININSSGIAGTFNRLTITDDALKSLVITGNRPLDVAVTAQNGVAGVSQLTSIDGSADTGNLSIVLSTPIATVQSALNIKTGSGNDSIAVTTSGTANSVGSTVTTGTGTDTIVVTTAIARDTNAVQFTTITDFAPGDRITFSNTLNFDNTHVSFGATPNSLSNALTAALLGVPNNTARWFVYDSNTYIVDNADGIAGFSSGDIVVKLSGTVNLSTATALFGSLSADA